MVGWPTLRTLAVGSGRTYVSIRHRASRLGAVRHPRLDPAERAARRPTEIPCRYCGSVFLGARRYALLRRRVLDPERGPVSGLRASAHRLTVLALRDGREAVRLAGPGYPGGCCHGRAG